MSSFILKIIALITMFIDHIGYAIYEKFSSFNYIGRLAFPIFAFQISEGYTHTKNLGKYFLRLIVFALISQIPYMLFESIFLSTPMLNIFFTLALGLLAILLYDKCKNKFLGILCSFLLALTAEITNCDYGFYGVTIILLFYIFKNNKILLSFSFIFATLLKYIIPILKFGFRIEYIYLFLCTSFSIIFILLYNGKKGKNIKYLLYLFYPIHLLAIYFIHKFL